MYDFLFDLVVDPVCMGFINGRGACGCVDIFRFHRDEMDSLALEWASDENLTWPDRVDLLLKLDKLPWHRDEITFHWGNAGEMGNNKR